MEKHAVAELMLTLLLTSMLSMALEIPVKAQYTVDPSTIALWHLDEVDSNNVTPDATHVNNGTLGGSPPPVLVDGRFGKALSYGGRDFVYVPISSSLNFQREFTIDAWINVKAFRNVTYNNIVVKCTRNGPEWENVTRICGLAVKAGLPENGNMVPQGALGGFLLTDEGGFNEIVTNEAVISLNQWFHVTFTRSLTTGMHIYVDGAEKKVKAIFGMQNPAGSVMNGTELYIGHDSEIIIDEVRISSLTLEPQISPFWMQWWFWTVIATGAVALVGIVYFLKKRKPS